MPMRRNYAHLTLAERQAYANAPECTPSRCALLTGRYQQRVGGLECAIGLGNVGRYDEAVWLQERGELGLPTSESTLPKLLKARGYDTAIFGKWHLGHHPQFLPTRHGFDEYFGLPYSNDMWPHHPGVAHLPLEDRLKNWPYLPLIDGDKVVNANIVLRWEYLPGSTVYLVWTHERFGTVPTYGGSFSDDMAKAFKLPVNNVILAKISYWWSL